MKVKGGYKSGEVLWMACVQLLVFANGAEQSRDYLGISSGHSALSPVMAEASFSPSLGQVPFPVHPFPSPFLPFPFLSAAFFEIQLGCLESAVHQCI